MLLLLVIVPICKYFFFVCVKKLAACNQWSTCNLIIYKYTSSDPHRICDTLDWFDRWNRKNIRKKLIWKFWIKIKFKNISFISFYYFIVYVFFFRFLSTQMNQSLGKDITFSRKLHMNVCMSLLLSNYDSHIWAISIINLRAVCSSTWFSKVAISRSEPRRWRHLCFLSKT